MTWLKALAALLPKAVGSLHTKYIILFLIVAGTISYHKIVVNRAHANGVLAGKAQAETEQREQWEGKVEEQKEKVKEIAKIANAAAETRREALRKIFADRETEANREVPIPKVIVKEIPKECDDAVQTLANSLNPFATRFRLLDDQIQADAAATGPMPLRKH